MCFTLRSHTSAAPPRGGLTQALGGRKTFSNYVLSREALQASSLLQSDSLSARPIFGYRMVRAQMLQASRLPASETAIVYCSFPRAGPAPSETAGGKSAGRARVFPLRLSEASAGFICRWHPPPPNNSFKPTPCRGVGCVLYATLARIRRPATGRLNSGVRPT
jgi:hypothetical protein